MPNLGKKKTTLSGTKANGEEGKRDWGNPRNPTLTSQGRSNVTLRTK